MSDGQDVFAETHLLRRAIADLSRRKVQLIDRAVLPFSTQRPRRGRADRRHRHPQRDHAPARHRGADFSDLRQKRADFLFPLAKRLRRAFFRDSECLSRHSGLPRSEAYFNVAESLAGQTPRRSLCVPFYPDGRFFRPGRAANLRCSAVPTSWTTTMSPAGEFPTISWRSCCKIRHFGWPSPPN